MNGVRPGAAKAGARLQKARELVAGGAFVEARVLLQRLVRGARPPALAWGLLAHVEAELGNRAEALRHARRALAAGAAEPALKTNVARVLWRCGATDEALGAVREALSVAPAHGEGLDLLGQILIARNELDEAEQVYRRAVSATPGEARLWANLAAVESARGYPSRAVAAYQEARRRDPRLPVQSGLASALLVLGHAGEAVELHREACRTLPPAAPAHSGYLLALNYLEGLDEAELLQAHRTWGERLASASGGPLCPPRAPDPDRRLRIGYLSPDLRAHSVASFLQGLLEAHDRGGFEIFCYSTSPREDAVSQALRAAADHWRACAGEAPSALAGRVAADGIDILVDLAGHTAHNSLPVFALRPAPLQFTYLGYPNTTGLPAIDGRIVDEITDPPGSERWCTEELVRVPAPFLAYRPPREVPDPSPPPAADNGFVTFGSFNNLSKVGPSVVAAWADLLAAVPGSRLLLKSPALTDPEVRAMVEARFRGRGIETARLELLGHTPGRQAHLALYRRLDIALDTFPYNGTTTTCEALLMGVPVVSLAGRVHRSRVGASLLAAIGRPEWVADDPARYVAIAAELAGTGTERLAGLRAGLRDALLRSPLCDAARLARGIEQAWRARWQAWCRDQGA
ncbi:O-linked N-acetylglucosamine transferase, SPINDLY family protein [Thiohalobacter sp.]|uniref:O-linked N-acetylglucosamine transferase, SPINDLY family protein n=1 Tax=Thiohalobacter sp. TaxID=2025948 RepID=UPI0026197B16|nr:tetratricopeptide repeat protein [Thiohalobacter sp.]